MNRFFEFIYWIKLFSSPFLLLSGIGVALYLSKPDWFWVSVVLVFLGAGLDVFFAEKIRRRHGTIQFMARVHHTDDIKSYDEIIEGMNKDEKQKKAG